MGAFNTVGSELICPICGRVSFMEVQFKYGNTWQYEYRLGERLRWGGNDIGEPGVKRVWVESIAGLCAFCNYDGIDCEVLIENDILVKVRNLPDPDTKKG